MSSELTQLLEQEARAEKDKLLAEARAKAQELLAAAHRDADEILAAGKRRMESEGIQARAQATSTASLKAAALVLAAKDEAIRKVFAQAEAELESATGSPARRRTMIRGLLREGAQGLPPGRVTVETSRGDAQIVREACRELKLDAEVRESDGVVDGVRLISADGRSVVENTVPSRMVRARREMVSRIAETLWGK